MITEDKRFIDIQGILAMSDVHPSDCIKINDLIIELSKENKKYKKVIDKAIEWVRDWTDDKNDWFEEDSKPSELLDILKEVENIEL